jgi:uncharacterized protein YabE (DUF348 family)
MVLLLIWVPMVNSPSAHALEKRMVTIYADGLTYTFPTEANTVGQALEKVQITLGEHDLVEPNIDSDITVDTFNINVYRARPVLVIDGDQRQQVLSPYQSPRLIAQEAGFEVYPEDHFMLSRIDDFIGEGTLGLKLNIVRATPLTLSLYGTESVIRTHAETVSDLFTERNIALAEGDIVRPELNTKISPGLTLNIIQVGNDRIVSEETIPFTEQIIQDSSKLVGYRDIQTAGIDGTKLVTYDVVYENDKEVSRKVFQEVVVKNSSEQVTVVGTKAQDPADSVSIGQSLAADRGWTGGQWTCLYELWMRESHWNPSANNPSTGAYGIPQAFPGNKMSSIASDWATNPATQITWGLNYISGRYASPCEAWNFFLVNNWY